MRTCRKRKEGEAAGEVLEKAGHDGREYSLIFTEMDKGTLQAARIC